MVRYDAFDCLTFVEEAISLSLGRTPTVVDQIRKDLRYGDGPISYENRNHFMVSQWIPNAIEKGYFKDITHTLGETHVVSKKITRRTWERWRGRHHFFFTPDQFPVGTYRMGVLSLDAAFNAIPNIPEGALVVVVRQNNPYNPVWITHLGLWFVIQRQMYESDTQPRWEVASLKSTISNGILSTFDLPFTNGRRIGSHASRVGRERSTTVMCVDRSRYSYSDTSHSAPIRIQSSDAPQAPVGTLKIDGPQPFAIQ